MSVTIALPNDWSAELAESSELTNRQVKELRRIARKVSVVGQKLRDLGVNEETDDDEEDSTRKTLEVLSHLSDDEDDSLDLFQRHCVVLRLLSWTVKNPDGSDRPIPATVEEVDDLSRPLYAILTKAASELNLNEDFTIDGGALDPKVPTES